jgi:hypothetical protein
MQEMDFELVLLGKQDDEVSEAVYIQRFLTPALSCLADSPCI